MCQKVTEMRSMIGHKMDNNLWVRGSERPTADTKQNLRNPKPPSLSPPGNGNRKPDKDITKDIDLPQVTKMEFLPAISAQYQTDE